MVPETGLDSKNKSVKKTPMEPWCPRQDLNLHALLHMLLRHTCIPISPLGLTYIITQKRAPDEARFCII